MNFISVNCVFIMKYPGYINICVPKLKKDSHLLVCFRVCDDVTPINCRHPVERCSVFIDSKDVCHLNIDTGLD